MNKNPKNFVGKLYTQKVESWHLCIDAVGVTPSIDMWTLQHPKKEAQDCFFLPTFYKKDFMVIIYKLANLRCCFESYISAEITYGQILDNDNKELKGKEYRLIVDMQISAIKLYNNLEVGQPNDCGQRGGD